MTDQEKNQIDTEACFALWCREIQKAVHENAVAKGFWAGLDHNLAEKIALCHSELSEALEAIRSPEGISKKSEKTIGMTLLAEELADTVIRIMDLCGHLGVDLGESIIRKHAYNLKRPYLHGKRF